MNLMNIAAELFLKKIGSGASGLDVGKVLEAMKGLLPTKDGELDIGELVGQFTGKGGGLASMAASWLGNGDNDKLAPNQLFEIFGESKVSEFASKLGTDTSTAAKGLTDMIPDLIDKSSEDGALLKSAAGELAGKFLGGLFK